MYHDDEARAIAETAFMFVLDTTRIQLSTHKKAELNKHHHEALREMLERLMKGEPLQYVTGETWFYECRIRVNPSVLIPRPETEFLVNLIVKEQVKPGLRIIDACTGSGCIAVALAKNLNSAIVSGFDVSENALKTARKNADDNDCSIEFFQYDLLNPAGSPSLISDILVSNPPYVTCKERSAMDRNVTEYEPAIALFVPDEDPLIFYRAILLYSLKSLHNAGRIFLESNENYAKEVALLFTSAGFRNVEIRNDQHGRLRFISATKGII